MAIKKCAFLIRKYPEVHCIYLPANSVHERVFHASTQVEHLPGKDWILKVTNVTLVAQDTFSDPSTLNNE